MDDGDEDDGRRRRRSEKVMSHSSRWSRKRLTMVCLPPVLLLDYIKMPASGAGIGTLTSDQSGLKRSALYTAWMVSLPIRFPSRCAP